MAGDGLIPPPVPHFWLVKYKFTTSFSDLHRIKKSFIQSGFRIFDNKEEPMLFKISHFKPKIMTLWLMKNSDLIKQFRLTITEYTHNTRLRTKDTVL